MIDDRWSIIYDRFFILINISAKYTVAKIMFQALWIAWCAKQNNIEQNLDRKV